MLSGCNDGHFKLMVLVFRLYFRNHVQKCFVNKPELEQVYPLNLSILLGGGKETNQDFPSNGE